MGEFFSIGSYNAFSLITTIVESQNHQKFGRASIDTGDDLLLVPDKQGALTSTALFPAKAVLNRDQEEALTNSARRFLAGGHA
jgi:hypothetical protein